MELTELSIENIECSQRVGGNIYASPTPFKVLDFSGNSNILKTPRNIVKALKKTNLTVHPDLDYKKAIMNLAQKYDVNYENIVLEKNSYTTLDLALKSLRARGATVVMPCETIYKDVCRINSCDILPYVLQERKNFKLDSDDLIEKITSRADTVIISNPNNVTGRVVSRSEIRNVLDFCMTKGIYVVVDETYMDFVPDGQSAVNLISEYYNLVVMRSVSEYYNLAGVRAAYAVSSPEIIENMKENQLPWQVDAYGVTLCENAYRCDKFDLKTKKWVFEEKRRFLKKLKVINSVKVIHSDCHYLLIKLEETSATVVYNRLLKSNILIRDASVFTGLDGSYIRVAVKDEKSNDRFIEALLRCLI